MKVGERVLLQPGISCGQCEKCLAGQDNMCRQYTMFGQMVNGGCAEYVKSPAVNVVPIPEKMSFEEAAAFPLVSITAWHMLMTRAQLKPAETVLVLAAGSGVGSAAIQIAKAAGGARDRDGRQKEKIRKGKELGADAMILHSENSISEEVTRMTNRRGVDVVIEHVGVATWDESIRSLAFGGRLGDVRRNDRIMRKSISGIFLRGSSRCSDRSWEAKPICSAHSNCWRRGLLKACNRYRAASRKMPGSA